LCRRGLLRLAQPLQEAQLPQTLTLALHPGLQATGTAKTKSIVTVADQSKAAAAVVASLHLEELRILWNVIV
jgi:hypothetical protein